MEDSMIATKGRPWPRIHIFQFLIQGSIPCWWEPGQLNHGRNRSTAVELMRPRKAINANEDSRSCGGGSPSNTLPQPRPLFQIWKQKLLEQSKKREWRNGILKKQTGQNVCWRPHRLVSKSQESRGHWSRSVSVKIGELKWIQQEFTSRDCTLCL